MHASMRISSRKRYAPHRRRCCSSSPTRRIHLRISPAASPSTIASTGTFLDSLRFRVHLARHLGVDPACVEAQILGEHGTSEVFLWSSARLAGTSVLQELARRGVEPEAFRGQIEREVRYANITIIEGNNASQYGIGMVAARIAQAVIRDERIAIPIGSHHVR